MGIHIFNPPEPFAEDHRRCGTCTAVPKLWKLTVPEYTGAQPFESAEPGNVILRRTTVRDGSGVLFPVWGPQFDQSPPTEPFGGNDKWRLEFEPFFEDADLPLPSPTTHDYWNIWILDEQAQDAPRRVVWYTLDEPDVGLQKFHCLGRNRFFFFDAPGHPGPGNGEVVGWPNYLDIEPWYGQ